MAGVTMKINARDVVIQVEESTDVWAEVGGLTSCKPNPGENEETAETTVFSDQGYYAQEIMQRGATLELEGFKEYDPESGDQDAGQAACEAHLTRMGTDSVTRVRFRQPQVDQEWRVWFATVTVGEQGGENNDKDSWSVTFTRTGRPTTMPVEPVGAAA